LPKSPDKTAKTVLFYLVLTMCLILPVLLTGCKSGSGDYFINDENTPLSDKFVIPQADSPGILSASCSRVTIDYSNSNEGYVTVRFHDDSVNRIKVVISGPDNSKYIYDLHGNEAETFPLSQGSGYYFVGVYENMYDDEYTEILVVSFDVMLDHEISPFIRSNQYVKYYATDLVADLTLEITNGTDCFFEIIETILKYIETNIIYDIELAYDAKPGFLPDVNAVLESGKGFCFDIAALFTAMLRIKGIPAQLAVGNYTYPDKDTIYHAWVLIYSDLPGSIGGMINVEQNKWTLIDPTFISSMGFYPGVLLSSDISFYEAVFIY